MSFIASTLKQAVRFLANHAGFEIRRANELPSPAAGIRHAVAFPEATYAPWLTDVEFQELYQRVAGHTLVDSYRCYELWQLVAESAKTSRGELIEIGVWRGGTGALIAKKCQLVGIEDMVYLCDTFKGVVKAGPMDPHYVGGEHANAARGDVLRLLSSLKLDFVSILEGIFPDDSLHLLEHHEFRFCHIDVDVYQSAKDIIDWIWPRLVNGGIVVYDDYGFPGCVGITRFVNEERNKRDRRVIHNLNGHAVVIKIASDSPGVTT
jgi:O-methyltransferase